MKIIIIIIIIIIIDKPEAKWILNSLRTIVFVYSNCLSQKKWFHFLKASLTLVDQPSAGHISDFSFDMRDDPELDNFCV